MSYNEQSRREFFMMEITKLSFLNKRDESAGAPLDVERVVTSYYDLPSELRTKIPFVSLTSGYYDEKVIYVTKTGEYIWLRKLWGVEIGRVVLAHTRDDGRYRLGARETVAPQEV